MRSATTRPDDEDDPEPPRRRQKDGTDSGGFRMVASRIMRRAGQLSTAAAEKITDAFSNVKAAVEIQAEKFFADIEDAPCEALDAANPYWDFSSEADNSSAVFEAGNDHSGGPSLHL